MAPRILLPLLIACLPVQAQAQTLGPDAGGCQPGGGPAIRVPQRRCRVDADTGRYRRLSHNQKQVNRAHARQRGPGERVNAELKNWKILRKIRCSPNRAGDLVAAVQTLMIASA